MTDHWTGFTPIALPRRGRGADRPDVPPEVHGRRQPERPDPVGRLPRASTGSRTCWRRSSLRPLSIDHVSGTPHAWVASDRLAPVEFGAHRRSRRRDPGHRSGHHRDPDPRPRHDRARKPLPRHLALGDRRSPSRPGARRSRGRARAAIASSRPTSTATASRSWWSSHPTAGPVSWSGIAGRRPPASMVRERPHPVARAEAAVSGWRLRGTDRMSSATSMATAATS